MLHDWPIQNRTDRCALTGRPFTAGEMFYALLYRDKHGAFHRVDASEDAWRGLQAADPDAAGDAVPAAPPFSFWRTKFIPPPPPDRPPEPLPKEDAETFLRRFVPPDGGLPAPEHERVCYVLALMLERKRRLRPVDVREEPGPDGRRLLFYEHAKTGESFAIVDPALRLDQIDAVQREIAELMAPAPAPEGAAPLIVTTDEPAITAPRENPTAGPASAADGPG